MNDGKHKQDKKNPQAAADIDEAVTAAGEQVTGEDETEDVRVALNQCQQELQQAKNDLLRAHADFDNFRKRMRAERDQEYARGSDRVLCELLPIVDDFERALAAVNDKSTVESVQQGVDLIYRQLLNMLERYCITQMTVEGKKFDPKYHDAVACICTLDHPEHTIIGEILRGYQRNEEVIRPAKVAVAVPPEEGGEKE